MQARLRGIKPKRKGLDEPSLSRAAMASLQYAALEARRLGVRRIGTEHLLLGVARTCYESIPWALGPLYRARVFGLISDDVWRVLWGLTRTSYLVVPELLEEFGLDLQSLRIAAAGQQDDHTSEVWTNEVQRLVEHAHKQARATGAGRVDALHLWLGLLAEDTSAGSQVLQLTGIDIAVLERHLRASLRSDNETASSNARYTAEAKLVFTAADEISRLHHCRYVGSDHLLLALLGAGGARGHSLIERARHIATGQPPSRADAAVKRALHEAGFDENYLREKVGDQFQPKKKLHQADPDVLTRIANIVAVALGLETEDVRAETVLRKEAASHLTVLDIFQNCKREFGITFTPEDARSIETVSDLANSVVEKVLKGESAERESGVSRQAKAVAYIALLVPIGALSVAAVLVPLWRIASTLLVIACIAAAIFSLFARRRDHMKCQALRCSRVILSTYLSPDLFNLMCLM